MAVRQMVVVGRWPGALKSPLSLPHWVLNSGVSLAPGTVEFWSGKNTSLFLNTSKLSRKKASRAV